MHPGRCSSYFLIQYGGRWWRKDACNATSTWTFTRERPRILFLWVIQLYSKQNLNCLHTKALRVTQYLKPNTQTPEPHTKSAKPYTDYRPLSQFSISWNSFCKKKQHTIMYVTHKNRTGINIMAKCLLLRSVCDIFEWSVSFRKAFSIVCVQLLDLCVKF